MTAALQMIISQAMDTSPGMDLVGLPRTMGTLPPIAAPHTVTAIPSMAGRPIMTPSIVRHFWL